MKTQLVIKAFAVSVLLCLGAGHAMAQEESVRGSAGVALDQGSVSGSAGAAVDVERAVSPAGTASAVKGAAQDGASSQAEDQSSATMQIQGCRCVTCADEFTNVKKAQPVFCGSAQDANTFLSRVDKDKNSDGVICHVSDGPSECPRLGPIPKFKTPVCTQAESAFSTVTETSDAFGVTCRAEYCGGNGCVLPDWEQTVEYKPYVDLPANRIREADRDVYYANRTNLKQALSAVGADQTVYMGPQVFCSLYPQLTAFNATTCIGPGGKLDITFGKDAITFVYRNGVTAPETKTLPYQNLTEEQITGVPYPYRGNLK